ncbi:hypothetical protein PFLUV_G00170440 [Perca fluviatilis]|uniref:Uncharacterized protein n=1 Tax=Perca fluviatilis TaxID=8168 RepID=A0A6A5EZC6_PERFL|nr:hypothetical protein PFLUV_G00170440 [Perca fluviatilis]
MYSDVQIIPNLQLPIRQSRESDSDAVYSAVRRPEDATNRQTVIIDIESSRTRERDSAAVYSAVRRHLWTNSDQIKLRESPAEPEVLYSSLRKT